MESPFELINQGCVTWGKDVFILFILQSNAQLEKRMGLVSGWLLLTHKSC